MIGALLAGILYRLTSKKQMSAVGEVIGTGVVGSFLSVPYAYLLMGTSVGGALAFLPGFLVSSVTGALIGLLILSR